MNQSALRLPSAQGHRGLVVGGRRIVPDAPQQEAEGVRRFRALDHVDQDRLGFRVRDFIAGVVGQQGLYRQRREQLRILERNFEVIDQDVNHHRQEAGGLEIQSLASHAG